MITLAGPRQMIDDRVKISDGGGENLLQTLSTMASGPAFHEEDWRFIISLAGFALAESMKRIAEAQKAKETDSDNG